MKICKGISKVINQSILVIKYNKSTYLLNFNVAVPGAMKPVWNWIWKIWVLDT